MPPAQIPSLAELLAQQNEGNPLLHHVVKNVGETAHGHSHFIPRAALHGGIGGGIGYLLGDPGSGMAAGVGHAAGSSLGEIAGSGLGTLAGSGIGAALGLKGEALKHFAQHGSTFGKRVGGIGGGLAGGYAGYQAAQPQQTQGDWFPMFKRGHHNKRAANAALQSMFRPLQQGMVGASRKFSEGLGNTVASVGQHLGGDGSIGQGLSSVGQWMRRNPLATTGLAAGAGALGSAAAGFEAGRLTAPEEGQKMAEAGPALAHMVQSTGVIPSLMRGAGHAWDGVKRVGNAINEAEKAVTLSPRNSALLAGGMGLGALGAGAYAMSQDRKPPEQEKQALGALPLAAGALGLGLAGVGAGAGVAIPAALGVSRFMRGRGLEQQQDNLKYQKQVGEMDFLKNQQNLELKRQEAENLGKEHYPALNQGVYH